MHIKISGCPDSDFKPYIERATLFYAKELIPNTRIRNNCTIRIKFDSKMNNYGSCGAEGYNTRNQPRLFSIEIHPGLGASGILSTLAHEMVHVKQLIFHETNDDLSIWKGKRFNSDLVDYWEHPWEIDAHGRESGLLTKFAMQENLWELLHGFKNPSAPIVDEPIRWKK